MKLSISCLPNFLQVSQESQVLLRPSQPPLSLLYTLQQISEFCWNFPIFFQFAVFTKITNLVELFRTSPFTAFSLMQWIFNFSVIFATACKPGHISFIIIVFHYSLARQCLWSLPGEVLFKSLPQNAKPVHVSPTGPRFCLKGGYITTIPWINYSTDSWESHYYYLTRGQYD